MIKGFFWLAAFQLLGEAIAKGAHLPIPGPVIGLVLLIALLLSLRRLRGREPAADPTSPLSRASDGILSCLGLLFVPAGVGVMQQGALVASRGAALLVILVVSTALTLLATVGVFLAVSRLMLARTWAR